VIRGRPEQHHIERVASLHADDDQVGALFIGDLQDLPITDFNR
jgi:hypothetical protein